ncbi:hypothetical protein EAI_17503 [Harpegnathos saltator]|uniref:N-acetyltransferase domain-containing protein n=1 Tax=Harpegnathos saltator TaxID=610380 RepID=E2BEV5_HARSA|nr:hypothetical protein EAI_17503 [Harpegnathos saltator]
MSGQNIAKLIEAMKKMTRVIRPLGPPKIWEVIEKKSKDGRPLKFTIQEIPKDRKEDVVEHMCKYFLEGEPTCACFNALNTPIYVEECRALWHYVLEQNIAVVAFVDNPNGGKPIIAGVNMLYVEFKEYEKNIEDIQFISKFSITYKVMKKLNKEVQLYDRYGVDKYLAAVGLSVAPPFRGYGLGTDILKIRNKVGREYDIGMTSTIFTSPFSVKSAEHAGFEMLLKKDFIDVVDENGKEYFPGVQQFSKSVAVMAKRL